MSGHERRNRPAGSRRRPTNRSSRAPRQTPADPARQAALDVLRAVSDEDAYANLAMQNTLRARELTGRDAALATELAYGTLRFQGTYDLVVAACLDRPLDALDPPVLDALRMCAHQLLATRVPTHAAVSTTVDLVRQRANEGAARLANAVARKVSQQDFDGWTRQLAPSLDDDAVEYLAFRHAHPTWVVRAILDALSGDLEELAACLEANNRPAEVHLVVRPGRTDVEELLTAGTRQARWSPYGAILESGDPASVPAVRAGRAGVQDEGSQLVALALAAVPVDEPDARWLDACAGPGGKAALLAGLATPRDARLLAVDQHEHRARLVEQALRGDPGEHEVLVADATKPPWPAEDFDRVLVDAPCTGLGALRRRPEARWRRQPSDVPELRRLQVDLLRSALWSVRPGGVVAYATCSPHLAETATVIADALRGRTDVEHVDVRPYLPGVPDLGDGPAIQLWPHRHGTDAMYLAILRRTV